MLCAGLVEAVEYHDGMMYIWDSLCLLFNFVVAI